LFKKEPFVFNGHTSNIKKCIFSADSSRVLSIADDKTLRVWDTRAAEETSNIKFENIPTSIEVSKDGQILILSHGKCVELYTAGDLKKIHTFSVPNMVSAASIHPRNKEFVCAGEDFTLYKYSISNGEVLGKLEYLFLIFLLELNLKYVRILRIV